MKTPIKGLSDKLLTIFFSGSLVVVCMCIVLCIRCLKDYHIYTDGGEYAKQYQLRAETESLSDEAVNYYYCTQQSLSPEYSGENNIFESQIDVYRVEFSTENSNMFFEIVNSSGETVFETKSLRTNADYQYSCSYPYMINFYDQTGAPVTEEGVITCYVASVDENGKFPAKNDDGYSIAFRWIDLAAKTGIWLFALFAIIALAAAILIGLLLCSAGTEDENGRIISKFSDRVPLDLYAGTVLLISAFAVGSVKLTDMSEETLVSEHSIIFIVSVVITALVIAFLLTVATRIKIANQNPGSGLFKNTLIYKGFAILKKKLGLGSKSKKEKKNNKKKVGFGSITAFISIIKVLGAISLIFFTYLEFTQQPRWQLYIVIWVIGHAIIMPLYFMLSYSLDKLKKNWQNLAEGKLDESIDDFGMFGMFKDVNKSLEDVRQEMTLAYENEAKSQMLRNELIANVSHDIKTPLTSIVNYVGLLKKDESISAQSMEYIEVLDFQAEKLKKLLVNLIEASAVSAGDVTVNFEPTDVRMLLEQTAAEYSEALRKQHLLLSLCLPKNEVIISADGHQLWRVFENLMSNICKYATEATGVRLSLEVKDKKAVIIFSNESKYKYEDGTGDMFLERFVRGDTSRNTEGNGLGLSIASNLTYLQNGTFEVSTNNNWFSVMLTFDIINPDGSTVDEAQTFADTDEGSL